MLYVRHGQKKISYRQKTALKKKSIAFIELKTKHPTLLYLFLKRKEIQFGGKKKTTKKQQFQLKYSCFQLKKF